MDSTNKRYKMTVLMWLIVAWWGIFDKTRVKYFYGQLIIGKTEWAAFESARCWSNKYGNR